MRRVRVFSGRHIEAESHEEGAEEVKPGLLTKPINPPMWLRRLAACVVIVGGALSLAISAFISLELSSWLTGCLDPPFGFLPQTSYAVMLSLAISGTVFLALGSALLWSGVHDLRACRKPPRG
jgi:hypothetical protein